MKKILIITQVVDRQHPILGFFHRWIEEFAKHCERVQVIALQVGTYDLPANVTVYSLGKEAGKGRLVYLWRFYRTIIQLRHQYDSVFVHMNQIYVILGGAFWRAWGKRIGLWYMHGTVSTSLKVAEKFAHIVFSGSAESFRLPSPKLIVTGHGIDVDLFKPSPDTQKDIEFITVGRISPAKNLEVQLQFLSDYPKAHLHIVGHPLTNREQTYYKELEQLVGTLGLTDRVHFLGSIKQKDLPQVLNRARAFLHTATNGSLDKSVLEALACGLPVYSSNEFLWRLPGVTDFAQASHGDFGSLEKAIACIRQEHSVQSLVKKLLSYY